jgi:hypothetical protein
MLPGNKVMPATEIAEYPFDVRQANELHITPGIIEDLLLSTSKFADAGYITIFNKEEVNIYNANYTVITVSRGAILWGWRDAKANMWRIPLVKVVRNHNTDTVMVNQPPTEFLPSCPPSSEAIYNVYELKMQPELVRYHHASARFPTKPTWLKAIKNKQFASWPGLTTSPVNCHNPNSNKLQKGHGQKTPSGLGSTKTASLLDDDNAFAINNKDTTPRPTTKQSDICFRVMDLESKAARLIYSDQTGQFPKKSSRGNQYIMVLVEIDSDTILIEPMKNRTSGKNDKS